MTHDHTGTTQRRRRATDFIALLDGTYEHSPWIAERAWRAAAVRQPGAAEAGAGRQSCATRRATRSSALIRAHPELAGKAMVAQDADRRVDRRAGQGRPDRLHARRVRAHPAAQRRLQREVRLSVHPGGARPARHRAWPRPRSSRPSSAAWTTTPTSSCAECLRNIHRIAEIRLDDKFGHEPALGNLVWDWAEQLAVHSDPGYAERGELTVTYLTDAHRACAQQLAAWMRDDCGFDEVGDRRGRQRRRHLPRQRPGGAAPADRLALRHRAQRRQVRRPARHPGADGLRARAAPPGPAPAVRLRGRRLRRRGRPALQGGLPRLGRADRPLRPGWLDQQDADGVTMREAMAHAGLRHRRHSRRCRRDPARYLGFVEVHIEQGPVLNEIDLPLGIVTSINGSVRYVGEIVGMASHAGTTPMDRRRDAATAAAELVLYVEQPRRCRCRTSSARGHARGARRLDQRRARALPLQPRHPRHHRRGARRLRRRRARRAGAPSASAAACTSGSRRRCAPPPRRARPSGSSAGSAPSAALGLPVCRMPSGAGHDAMKLHEVMPQAMLFMRGMNAGISHNPLEVASPTTTPTCACAPSGHLLDQLAAETHEPPTTRTRRSTPGSTPTSTRRCASCRSWCACRPTRRRATTRRTPNAPPSCCRASASRPRSTRCPPSEVRDYGLESHHQPDRAPPLRRRPRRSRSTPTATWCRRARAGRTTRTAARSTDGRLYGRAAAVSKSDFATYTFAVRALESLGARLAGRRSSCTSPTTRNSAASSAPAGCCATG